MHSTLPETDWTKVNWKPSAQSWLAYPHWEFGRADELHFYVDGSFSGGQGGAGIVLFPKVGPYWSFGGFIREPITSGNSAYQSELGATLIALKWTWDLLRALSTLGFWIPKVCIHFDSTSAGFAVAGECAGGLCEPLFVGARAFVHIIQTQFQIEVEFEKEIAHSGNPGNEMADDVANLGRSKQTTDFWAMMSSTRALQLLPWIWILHDTSLQPFIEGNALRIPKPKNYHDPELSRSISGQNAFDGRVVTKLCNFQLRVMTYNALTLKGNRSWKEAAGLAGAEGLLWQCDKFGFQVIALQETRLRKNINSNNPYYHTVSSFADERGNGGVTIGLSKRLAACTDDEGKEHFFTRENMSIVVSNSNLLIVKVRSCFLKALLVVPHAPHTGYSEEEIRDWWIRLRSIVSKHSEGYDVILAGDTKIGQHQEECETITSRHLIETIGRFGLWAPATFESCQVGPGATWFHPNGTSMSRLDYVLLPETWRNFKVTTWTQPEIGAQGETLDHVPACARIEGQWALRNEDCLKDRRRRKICVDLKNEQVRSEFRQSIGLLPEIDWNIDVHQHVKFVHDSLNKIARKLGSPKKFCRKDFLQEDTWDAVQEKSQLRYHLWQTRINRRKAFLTLFFTAWRSKNLPPSALFGQLRDSEKENAGSLHKFGRKSKEVQILMRRDEKAFFNGFAERLERSCEGKDLKTMWSEIKRYIPKHKQRKQATDPKKYEGLRDKWIPHVCDLEAGKTIDAETLVSRCLDRQDRTDVPKVSLLELPTLLEIEASLRNSKEGKQGGLEMIDPSWVHWCPTKIAKNVWKVAMKMHLWCTEPVQWKGGALAMIAKTPQPSEDTQSFRGIMLSSEIGKRVQATVRTKLVKVMERGKPTQQIGGYRSMEPVFGSHYCRTYTRICSAKKLPSCLLFVDLSAAYHGLIRQLLTGADVHDREDLDTLQHTLEKEGFDLHAVRQKIAEGGILQSLGATEHTIALMKELNRSTWANLFGQGDVILTARGSRPGSPLADIQFNGIMHSAGNEINQALRDHPMIREALATTNLPGESVIWADDLALPIPLLENDNIGTAVGDMMFTIREAFRNRGLKVNFKRAKTEAIPTCVGNGARQARKDLLMQTTPGVLIEGEDQKDFLRYQGRYKHLGTQHETAGGLGQEIVYRIGSAWGAFRTLRPILCRRSLPVQTRLMLLKSLILSKLFYGAGSWHSLSKQQFKKLSTCYMNLIRQTVGQVFSGKTEKKAWTDSFLLQHYLLPDLRSVLGEMRLLYARRVWIHGGDQLKKLLLQEAQVRGDSWLHGLDEDLLWLIKTQGNSWGDTPDSIRSSWLLGRVGWKSFVKNAIKRHTLQESIAERLLHQNNPTVGPTGGAFTCECGASFLTLRGLQTHRHKKHSIYSQEYGLCGGTICPVCLHQFWTRGRLSQHLSYIPVRNLPNPCFSYMKTFGYVRAEGEEPGELPLQGLNRREAIRVYGPYPFGADPDDQGYAEKTIAGLENMFDETGFGHPDDHFDEDFIETVGITLEQNRSDWAEAVEALAELHQKNFFATNVALLFAGVDVFREHLDDKEDWLRYLRSFDLGQELIEWFWLKLHLALLLRVKDCVPHRNVAQRRPVKQKHVDGWERKIDLCLYDAEGNLVPEVSHFVKPKASIKLLYRAIDRFRDHRWTIRLFPRLARWPQAAQSF